MQRVRITAVAGALAAFGLAVGFFLPWVSVRPDRALAFRERVTQRLEELAGAHETGEDWTRLADHLVERGAVSGLDVYFWARTARQEARIRREEREARAPSSASGAATPVDLRFERAALLLGVVLASVPIGGVLLGLYFLMRGFRSATSPVLVLAMALGIAAVSIPAASRILGGVMGEETDASQGLPVLLVSGFVLFLAGAFGVRAENWWRTFLGLLLLLGAVGGLSYAYLRAGVVP